MSSADEAVVLEIANAPWAKTRIHQNKDKTGEILMEAATSKRVRLGEGTLVRSTGSLVSLLQPGSKEMQRGAAMWSQQQACREEDRMRQDFGLTSLIRATTRVTGKREGWERFVGLWRCWWMTVGPASRVVLRFGMVVYYPDHRLYGVRT